MGKFQKVWTDDPQYVIDDIVPKHGAIDLGTEAQPFDKIYVNQIITGGETEDYTKTAYAAGTAYTLTATSAALDFVTTDPVVVLDAAGTWRLNAQVTLAYAGATFVANQTVTLKLRRTNNTAADVANSTATVVTGVVTTVTGTFIVVTLPPVLYTTALITDSLTIFGDVSVVPSAGALNATAASIIATRLY